MAITWANIILLAKQMIDVNQNDIARHLNVDRSTISRLMNGKTSHFERKNREIYSSLFDPTIDSSLVYNKNPMELLEILKEKIKEMGLADETKSLTTNDYEKFVKGLLQLARGNEAKSSTNVLSENKSTDNIQISENPQIDNASAVISYSKDCEMCLCCGNWGGSFQYAIKSVSGSYGKCLLFSKDALSADKCDKFAPNYEKIVKYENHRKQQNIINFFHLKRT